MRRSDRAVNDAIGETKTLMYVKWDEEWRYTGPANSALMLGKTHRLVMAKVVACITKLESRAGWLATGSYG